jgi:4-oxalmesaconate hydratase
MGFVGLNLNPDPDRGLVARASAHGPLVVSAVREDGRTGRPGDDPRVGQLQRQLPRHRAHYINADTTAFMQFIQGRPLFKDFPDLRLIIPHGGGAVPYHWGRYRGLADMT